MMWNENDSYVLTDGRLPLFLGASRLNGAEHFWV